MRSGVVAFAAAATLVVAGCGGADYDHTDIQNVKPSPLGGNMNFARIEVPVGMIVTAHIVSYDDDHKAMNVALQARTSGIVETTSVVSQHDYAFLGLKKGDTEVELTADGKVVLIWAVRVVDQPAPP